MNKDIQEMKSILLRGVSVVNRTITEAEYEKLSQEEKEKYYYKHGAYNKDGILDITDEEINTYANIQIIKNLDRMNNELTTMNENQRMIKNILMIWFVLGIINLLGMFYVISKIGIV